MKNLFIDTTNNFCFVGLYDNDKLIKSIKLAVNKNVTDIIVDSINKLLISAKVEPDALTHMCVNIGPGSFTGVKVGVVVAKAWKLFNPKLQISTIDSLLLQTKTKSAISVINAKSKKLYLAIYSKGKTIVEPCLIDSADLDKYLNKYTGLKLVQDQTDKMYSNFRIHFNDFKKVTDIEKLEPLYLKDPV